MNEVGLLWQSGTITEAHEHFISYLIKQKLLINTERIQIIEPSKNEKVFVLYLPENEIHELGLMYLNYEILLHGYKTIYLGESVPIDSLKNLKNYFEKIVFVGYLTVQPEKENVANYMNQIENEILDNNSEVWLIGRMTQYIETSNNNNRVSVFNSIDKFVNNIS
jgi:methanogenic corrinoid protein MtbC1